MMKKITPVYKKSFFFIPKIIFSCHLKKKILRNIKDNAIAQ